MKYKEEIIRAMNYLGAHEKTIFLGQQVEYAGNAVFKTLADVPAAKKIELPVFEEVQMGMSIGLALECFIPVTIYPRFNFLLLALNQLVNHLDKIEHMSHGQMKPRVIIKVLIGSERPLDPGVQHKGDFTAAFLPLLKNVDVVRLDEPEQIFPAYQHALERTDGKSTLLIEYGDYYTEK
ncbi:hypothetical protein HZC31_08340 [Candidatus Woesearchaeota archaeon]|nr:hypothetical protein [Candidatus Woesearchaeota archaeon]